MRTWETLRDPLRHGYGDVPQQLLDSIPIPLVFVLIVAVLLIAFEIGFRGGRWWQDRTPGEHEGPTGTLVGSLLALMAFLLAITMGMASDRFDARRGLVLDEANAIGTTYLRAGYLPAPVGDRAASCSASTSRCGSVRATGDSSLRTSPRPRRSTPKLWTMAEAGGT